VPKFAEGGIPKPDSSPFNSHVYCSHGRLSLESGKLASIISGEVYDIIRNRYPTFNTLRANIEECTICDSERIEHLDERTDEANRAKEEKALYWL
jgi:hypothetical protein